jgi:hypothetical protein
LKNIKLTVSIVVLTGIMGVPPIHADWTGDGIPVCTASGAQDSPAIVSDGSDGAIVAWRDSRPSVNTDIYGQGLSRTGAIEWYDTGMPACTAANSQSTPLAVPDGAGGAIIAWQDSRTGGSLAIYAQKLDSSGYIQWTSNGVLMGSALTGLVIGQLISDGAGGAIVVWQDRRNFYNDIFAQRIASNGSIQWTADGVPVCTADMHQQNPTIAPDGSGGAIIAWQDNRDGNDDIYAQRLDAAGNAQWTADGVKLCDNAQPQRYPQAVQDGSGGTVVAWMDHRNTMDFDIFAQRVDSGGNLLWGAGGATVSARMYDQTDCRLVYIGSGETVITWLDGRSGTSVDVYAQKLNASGTAQWTLHGVVVCSAAGDQTGARIVSNGLGGAFIVWQDARAGASNLDIYAQDINPNGSPAWTADGEMICGAAGNQTAPALAADQAFGAVVAWTDTRSGTDKVYSHRFNANGDIPTATLLAGYSAAPDGTDIRLDWTLSEMDEGIDFIILRASEPEMNYSQLAGGGLIERGLSFSFMDRNCRPGTVYHYRVAFSDGIETTLLFETGPVHTAETALLLHQNIPNPFNPRTIIRYAVPRQGRVRLEVFDVTGRRIEVLVDKIQEAGSYAVDWNGREATGALAASGVYIYRLTAGKTALSRKMILLR